MSPTKFDIFVRMTYEGTTVLVFMKSTIRYDSAAEAVEGYYQSQRVKYVGAPNRASIVAKEAA